LIYIGHHGISLSETKREITLQIWYKWKHINYCKCIISKQDEYTNQVEGKIFTVNGHLMAISKPVIFSIQSVIILWTIDSSINIIETIIQDNKYHSADGIY
jgi:hypothetical protein